MLEIPNNSQAEMDSGELNLRFLFKFEFDSGTLYLTNAQRNVYTNEDTERITWIPHDIIFNSFKETKSEEVDTLEIDASTLSGELDSSLLAENYVGKSVEIYIAFFGKGYGSGGADKIPYGAGEYQVPVDEPRLIFSGKMDSAELKNGRVSLQCNSEFVQWNRPTLKRTYSQTCPWIFKGTRCEYSGYAKTCDKSYTQCKAYGMAHRYGGFRHMGELMNKELKWGRDI